MLSKNDLFLFVVVYSSIALGILFPRFFAFCQPLPLYCLMALFFFSYLPIRMDLFVKHIRSSVGRIAVISILKLFLFPMIIWLFFQIFFPSYAAAALLLSAISCGVTAPFIAGVVGANVALVLTFVVVTSFLIPFSVPALIKLLLGRSTAIPLGDMMWTLVMIIFMPAVVTEILKRTVPAFIQRIETARYPVSLALFGITNLGVFSQYSGYFYKDPSVIIEATVVAVFLSVVYVIAGILALRGRPIEDRVAGAIMFANINNILVLVFASKFFGVTEATLAAMYNIPYFGVIVLLRLYQKRHLSSLTS